jgi:3-methylcrotonyl-CoA carboxylase alpha subunit
MRDALAACDIAGPKSNVEFLENLVRHPAVVSGKIDTGYLDRHLDEFLRKPSADRDAHALLAAATAWLLHEEQAGANAARTSGDPHSPWAHVDGWRLAHPGRRIVALADRGERREVVALGAGGRYSLALDDVSHVVANAVFGDGILSAAIDGETRRWRADIDGDRVAVHDGVERRVFHHAPAFEYVATAAGSGDRVVAPMPGRIVLVKAKAGDDVAEGDEVLVMEAMKMELTLRAPRAGRIDSVQAAAGDFVEADAVLVKLAAA